MRLRIGDWYETTPTLANAGGTVSWPTSLVMRAEVNADILSKEHLEVVAMDENSLKADDLLGSGTISLRKLASMFGQQVELSVDLKGEKGVAAGRVTFRAELTSGQLGDLNDGIPDSAVTLKDGKIRLHEITLLDMVAVKGDKELPLIGLKLDSWRTELVTTATAKSRIKEWKESEKDVVELKVNNDVLLYKKISVSVTEKGMLQNQFLGSGELSLRRLGSSSGDGEKIEHFVRLKDVNGRPAGRMRVVASLQEESQEVVAAISKMVASEELGALQVIRCRVSDLVGVAAGKKVVVTVECGEWKVNSPPLEAKAEVDKASKKSSVVWNAKLSTHTMPVSLLRQRGVTISVKPAGSSSTSTLGSAVVPLDAFLVKAGDAIDCEQDLKAGAKKTGKMNFQAKYLTEEMISNGGDFFPPAGDESESPPPDTVSSAILPPQNIAKEVMNERKFDEIVIEKENKKEKENSIDLEALKTLESTMSNKISQLEGGLQGQLKEVQ